MAQPPLLKAVEPTVPVRDVELPVNLQVGKHTVAFRVDKGQTGTATEQTDDLLLKMRINNYTYYDDFDVTLNGHRLAAESRTTRAVFIMSNESRVMYPVNMQQLVLGDNELVVEVRKLNPAISVTPQLVGLEFSGQ